MIKMKIYSKIKHFMKYNKGYILVFVTIALMAITFCSCNNSTVNKGENVRSDAIHVELPIGSPTNSPNVTNSPDISATAEPTKTEPENTPEATIEITPPETVAPEIDVNITIPPTESPEDSIDYENFIPSGPLAINEAMSVNDMYLKQNDGKYYDWVEFKNISESDINLSDYYFTDKLTKMKYRLPDVNLKSGGLFTLICSSKEINGNGGYYHANFSLSSSGENIYILDSNGLLLDAAHLENIPYGSSYGRMETQNGFYYFTKPTPGKDNVSGIKNVCKTPECNFAPGVYNEPSLNIELKSDGIIYYTLDGTEPTANSTKYTKPIFIDKNTIIRTLVCKEGCIQSKIDTFSYILRPDTKLPVLSLVTAPDNLWSEETGIYVKGKYDNYYQDWEKYASLSYYGDDGTFSIDCGLKMNGSGSRESDKKKSFKVIFRGKYGSGTLDYNLFNNGVTEFDSLVLRAGEDFPLSIIRNEVAVAYAAKYFPSLITQKGKYCSLYINGEYLGIYYLMERVTEKFISEHYGVLEDDVIIEEHTPDKDGELYKLMIFARNNDLSNKKNYDYIASKIDLESMTDWFIFQAFTGNTDASGNIRYVKAGSNAKWKWVAYDFDWAFYFHKKAFQNMIEKDLGVTSSFIKPLLQNSEYRTYFIERFSYYAKNVFNDPQKLVDFVDEYYNIIKYDVPAERALWGGSVQSWEQKIKELKGFVLDYNRQKELQDSLKTTLNMTDAEVKKYF